MSDTLSNLNIAPTGPVAVEFECYELTKRAPRTCQLDKGAAPPYNPPLLACAQHLEPFTSPQLLWDILSQGNIAKRVKVTPSNGST